MKDWDIPGLAIAVVKDGKVVVMKGYGVRDVNTKQPVDENTLFLIASNSKLFTGTALAQLDYNHKISLDDKVSKYLKGYALGDTNISNLLTIRDLLSHRIGTKTFQGDFVFWNSNLARHDIMRRMKLLKQGQIFRQDYGYCNSCFMTAGEVIPVVTGKPWEVYVYDSILEPLEMKNTYTLSNGISQRENVAKPYTNSYTGKLTELPLDNVDNIGPAASIISNVKDLSNWLLLQLDSGRYNGKRILPWPVLQRTRDMNIVTRSRRSMAYPTHFQGYGLGVFVGDYNGRQIYFHTGGADGFVTNTCFVPEENLGITILTNNDNQNFFELLRYQILDAYLNVPYQNRSKLLLGFAKEELEQTAKQTEALQARVKPYPLSLSAFTGMYENELYGNIKIEMDNKGRNLVVHFPGNNNLWAKLEYMDKDEWLLSYNNLTYGIFPVRFKMADTKATSIELRVNGYIDPDPYTFKRK